MRARCSDRYRSAPWGLARWCCCRWWPSSPGPCGCSGRAAPAPPVPTTRLGPSVVSCPAGSPITPPPLPRDDIPAGDSDALKAILTALPPAPTAAQGTAALAALPKPPVDSGTGPAGVPPTVTSTVQGADVGVALRGGDSVNGIDCVFGLRQADKVWVWAPSRVQIQPGELGCEAGEAFSKYAQTSPH